MTVVLAAAPGNFHYREFWNRILPGFPGAMEVGAGECKP